LLVDLVVIDAEFDRKDHSSIPATAIRRELKSVDIKTDSRTRLNWRWKKNKNETLIKNWSKDKWLIAYKYSVCYLSSYGLVTKTNIKNFRVSVWIHIFGVRHHAMHMN
jgi:hypothetical protein